MFQVGHSNLETVSFSNGPTFIRITNEKVSLFEPLLVISLFLRCSFKTGVIYLSVVGI